MKLLFEMDTKNYNANNKTFVGRVETNGNINQVMIEKLSYMKS